MGSPQNYYGVGFYEGLTGGAGQTYGPRLPTSSLTSGSFAQFTNRTNAYTSNNQYATGTVGQGTAGQTQAYGTLGLSVPATNTISGIEVHVEGKATDPDTERRKEMLGGAPQAGQRPLPGVRGRSSSTPAWTSASA